MIGAFWLIELDQVHSSYLMLATLAALGLLAGVLFQVGALGWLLQVLGKVIRGSIHRGFVLWVGLLSWASWPLFLVIAIGLLVLGSFATLAAPGLTVLCALVTLLMGLLACLAYMFIDLERYEVERGYKAVHNPLKGQEWAAHLARYGHQVRVPLLCAATVAVIGGFAQLNQGLYETIGTAWYQVGNEAGEHAAYVDFLAYALIHLLGIVDILNLAQSHHWLRTAHVHATVWPATTLLAAFKAFFTLVLLQQIFASLRQGKLLAETITDFWSPHEPIHLRARNALPQYGVIAIGPLLMSLRSVASLTKEQRDQLPLILATIGPMTIPALVRHLRDPHEHVRAVAAATLGHLRAFDTLPLLVPLSQDPSDLVRQSAVEAIGLLAAGDFHTAHKKRWLRRVPRPSGKRIAWLFGRRARVLAATTDPTETAVTALGAALADESAAVRTMAAQALGQMGPSAAPAAPGLIALLKDADETARCQAAEALGLIGGPKETTVQALAGLLGEASAPVRASAARDLGALQEAAAPAIPALMSLLQDQDESVRTTAAQALAQVGSLEGQATGTLAQGLESPDNLVRAQTAEALGTIGTAAQGAASSLVEAAADSNDLVRAKAVQALGKIGEAAAEVAVPSLVRALRDQDNWVSALAAEALGQLGESADGAVPALIRCLAHLNPQVRGNAAEALGKLGPAAAQARPALERASQDEDGKVRSEAIRALGQIDGVTAASEAVGLAALRDADPQVRAAAVEAVGQWGKTSPGVVDRLTPLLEDASDLVKVQVARVLPQLTGPTPAILDGLCRRLLEDDSAWVQEHAALALGKLGTAAVTAGGPLLRAAQTGAVSVREQAMRALALIQPPEAIQAFASGLKDASSDVRKVASAGLIKAGSIPEEVIPVLIEALRDPELSVRANAAHTLGRLEPLPPESIPLLIECTAQSSDGLRMNAAMALKRAPASAVSEVMEQLCEDPELRVRLIAASFLLPANVAHARAGAILVEALNDPALRVRKAALELLDALGENGAAFLENLQKRGVVEEEPELRTAFTRLIERFQKIVASVGERIAG